MDRVIYIILPLIAGWILDKIFGDPEWLPHPVTGFGKLISSGEKKLNKKSHRVLKGAVFSIILTLATFFVTYYLLEISGKFGIFLSAIVVYFSLAGKTLISEVRKVFVATAASTEEGRKQVGRIVGRDTSTLSNQEVRKAALETLAENLSDGVIAPLFWYMVLGAPGMLTYKMINTLDSMIGYKNERYLKFGRFAARMDDIANYIPARMTAFLMIVAGNDLRAFSFIRKYGSCHTSPNSGYPESALAALLNCRFGGPNWYFGQLVNKPYIGENEKTFDESDLEKAVTINKRSEIIMILIIVAINLILIRYV